MIAETKPFALTGVVVTEILQGLKRDMSRVEHYLAQWEMYSCEFGDDTVASEPMSVIGSR
jgi:hypothetical protein